MQDIRDITVRITDETPGSVAAAALVLNGFKDEKGSLSAEWADLDKALNGALAAVLQSEAFKGVTYEAEPVYTLGHIAARQVLLICAGPRERWDARVLRNVAAAAARKLRG